MDGRKLVVVLGGTVPASGGSERMSKLLKAGTFPRDSSLILSPAVSGIKSLCAFVLADRGTQDRQQWKGTST